MPSTPLRVLVVGSGAVGGYYGAMLVRAGHQVTFVARGEHGEAIRTHGLVVEMPTGSVTVRAPVLGDVAEAAGLGADVAIVAVKAGDLPAVAAGVGRALRDGGVAVPLLNGLDSENELARVIGADRVVGAIAQIASRIVSPGKIRVDGPARIVLSPLVPSDLAKAERLAASLACPGFECDAKSDLQRALWTKLLWNAPFNAVCALTRRTAGEVLSVPELEALVRAAMQEVAAVARAEGVAIENRTIEASLEATRTKYAATIPSMLQDVLAHRRTEARALQGAVVERGSRHKISTPIHEVLLALVLGLERTIP